MLQVVNNVSTKVTHHCLKVMNAGANGVFICLNRPFTSSIKANITQMRGIGAYQLYRPRHLRNADKSAPNPEVLFSDLAV